MGLFSFGKKKSNIKIEMRGFDASGREVALKENTKPDIIHSIEYYETLKREVKPLEDILVGFSTSLSAIKNTDDRIEVLKSLISSFYNLKTKCISLGPDFQEYFSSAWEHCHNSKSPDFSFIERYQDELEHLQTNRDELVVKEALHASAADGLEEKVLTVLMENPSILQTDIYKRFDPTVQNDIQSILYFLAKDGVIIRTKSGRTYQIDLQKER